MQWSVFVSTPIGYSLFVSDPNHEKEIICLSRPDPKGGAASWGFPAGFWLQEAQCGTGMEESGGDRFGCCLGSSWFGSGFRHRIGSGQRVEFSKESRIDAFHAWSIKRRRVGAGWGNRKNRVLCALLVRPSKEADTESVTVHPIPRHPAWVRRWKIQGVQVGRSIRCRRSYCRPSQEDELSKPITPNPLGCLPMRLSGNHQGKAGPDEELSCPECEGRSGMTKSVIPIDPIVQTPPFAGWEPPGEPSVIGIKERFQCRRPGACWRKCQNHPRSVQLASPFWPG